MSPSDTRPTSYRLFWTNHAGRIASAPDVVEARDDGEAIRQAEIVAQGRAVEL